MAITNQNQSQNLSILHASDLHIGAHVPEMLRQFSRLAHSLAPDLVILSGDLTDGGRDLECDILEAYLTVFQVPVFIVPGNHDAPVDNLWARVFSPFERLNTLSAHMGQFRCCGLNVSELRTAAPIQARLDWSKGVATQKRVDRALGRVVRPMASSIKDPTVPFQILVGHHPIVDAPDVRVRGDVIGGQEALTQCHGFGVDLILSGHTHQSWFGRRDGFRPILATAPTLSSPRLRGEAQGFHAYTIAPSEIVCDVWRWDASDFALEMTKVQNRLI